MVRKKVVLLLLTCFTICFLTACNKQPSKRAALHRIDKRLDEQYELVNEEHYVSEYDSEDNRDVYTIHLTNSDINIDVICHINNNDAWHTNWVVQAPLYYETKFFSLAEKRRLLRDEKYPHIKEDIISNGDGCYKYVITIDSKDYCRELFDYLCEVYVLNDFRYYNMPGKCWDDNISLHVECNGKRILFTNFADLRREYRCSAEEIHDLISYEEFMGRLENID